MLYGVKLDGVDTLKEYGLMLLADVKIGTPKLKETRKSIPGANGDLNLSYAITGRPTYENRPLDFSLFRSANDITLTAIKSALMGKYHGREVRIQFPFDRSRYYTGVLSVGETAGYNSGKFSVSAEVYPYKLEINTSSEPWLWDDFNFESDIARDYSELPVDGESNYTIVSSTMPVMPKFIVKSRDGEGIDVGVKNSRYHLSDGESTIPGFFLESEDYTLTFSGYGTVTVEFRGGEF